MRQFVFADPQEPLSNFLPRLKFPQWKVAEALGVHRRSLERWMSQGLTVTEAEIAAKRAVERHHRIPEYQKKDNMLVSITPDPSKLTQVLVQGDCVGAMKRLPDESIDLVVTSPPYATQRKATYGGTPPDKYVEWFLPISAEIKRVLKPTGSFVLNIKENVVDGERSTYVMELIMALRQQGWRWVDDYIWHKRNTFPGKWPNRFRDAWEHCLHFTKQKDFRMYQDAVKQPAKPSTLLRAANLSEQDRSRRKSQTLSGLDRDISHTCTHQMVLPDNVLYLATETRNKGHSAAFPDSLPEWFIKLLTLEGDTVLDPFAGSGTTCRVAERMNRTGVGIEIH